MHYGDVMLGPGGKFLHPVSESDALTAAIHHVTNGAYREALDVLKALRSQVKSGFHRNPYKPFRIVGTIAEDVYDIRYRHEKDRRNYEHEFDGTATILAVERHGKRDLIITSNRGLPLWDEFPD